MGSRWHLRVAGPNYLSLFLSLSLSLSRALSLSLSLQLQIDLPGVIHAAIAGLHLCGAVS